MKDRQKLHSLLAKANKAYLITEVALLHIMHHKKQLELLLKESKIFILKYNSISLYIKYKQIQPCSNYMWSILTKYNYECPVVST